MVQLQHILVSLAIIFIAWYFFTKRQAPQLASSNDFLIYGIPSSQKTRIFYKLVTGKDADTTTSFVTNRVQIETDGTIYTLVDFPGNSSFDKELFASLKPGSHILFPIDSSKKLHK